jgi:ribosomal protein S27E
MTGKTIPIRCVGCGHEGLAQTAKAARLRCSVCGGRDWRPVGRPNRVYLKMGDSKPWGADVRLPAAPAIDASEALRRGSYP